MTQIESGFKILVFSVIWYISRVISRWVPICCSVHPWGFHGAVPLGNQAVGTMIWYPTQPHYPDTTVTNLCPILLMLSARLGRDKYHYNRSLVWLSGTKLSISRTPGPRSGSSVTALSPPGLHLHLHSWHSDGLVNLVSTFLEVHRLVPKLEVWIGQYYGKCIMVIDRSSPPQIVSESELSLRHISLGGTHTKSNLLEKQNRSP